MSTLARICSVTAAGGTSEVGTGGWGSGGWRVWRVWHTSAEGSRMGWDSRHRAALEMLPITRQRWMRAALRWCSGRLGVAGVFGGEGSLSGVPPSWRRCRRAQVRRAPPLALVSRTRAGSSSRCSRAASAFAESISAPAARRPSILPATAAAHCSRAPHGTIWGMRGAAEGEDCGGVDALWFWPEGLGPCGAAVRRAGGVGAGGGATDRGRGGGEGGGRRGGCKGEVLVAAGATEATGAGSAREARAAALVTGRVRVAGPVEGMGVARVVCAGEVGVSRGAGPAGAAGLNKAIGAAVGEVGGAVGGGGGMGG